MKPPRIDDKPAADQASLQDLLSAAYVVQKHNERLHTGQPPETGHSQILKEILEVQEQLRSSSLDLREKTALIARRVRQMTQASGSAIGLVTGDQIEYCAATGSAASEAGASMPQQSSLARECLKTGRILQCPSVESDPRVDSELCQSLGVKALIAVPVKHEGAVTAVLEVHFSQANSFHEQDVRACQMASALVAEAIVKPLHQRDTAIVPPGTDSPKTSPAATPSIHVNDNESLLIALEKIRPKLERMANNSGLHAETPATPRSRPLAKPAASPPPVSIACRNCGQPMMDDEVFCSGCGSPRQSQRIWSSLLELQRKAEHSARHDAGASHSGEAFDDPLEVFPSELEEIVSRFSAEPFETPGPHSSEVLLPPFARGLVEEKASAPESPSKEDMIRLLEEDSKLEDSIPEDGTLDNSAETASSTPVLREPLADTTTPFLLEKSPPPPTELYPPFAGFASDTNLLSLPTDSNYEAPLDATAREDEFAPWKPAAAEDESSPEQSPSWSSAARTKEWLEVEREKGPWLARVWQQHRANIYLVAAGVLLVAALFGWSSPSTPPASTKKIGNGAKAHQEDPPQPELSLSDKLLVGLGLAEAPPVEVADPGNPETQVWIDVHTALYYCPGTDLYGKTVGGRKVTQLEAQQDHFEPAMRKACQ